MSAGVYYEVHYWDGKEKVETFIRLFVARERYEELYKAHGYYNLKLIKYVTTSEILDKGYERNVSMMEGRS